MPASTRGELGADGPPFRLDGQAGSSIVQACTSIPSACARAMVSGVMIGMSPNITGTCSA
jgi:hypothetical protein